jgi:hypothetical protein
MGTNTPTRCVLAHGLLLVAVLAHAAADSGDAIANCRARYAAQPPEHIACLERELRALGAAPKEGVQPGLGAEQLRTKPSQDTIEQVSVEIQNVTYGFDGRGVFQLADGQVWKGTESTPNELRLEPGRSYAGRIERGKFGGYRMYIDGTPRMIKVMRMQ